MKRSKVLLLTAGIVAVLVITWVLRLPGNSRRMRISTVRESAVTSQLTARSEPAAPAKEHAVQLEPVPGAFGSWIQKYAAASPPEQSLLLPEGEQFAKQRRILLKELIQRDPEAALAMAVPYSVRKQLPASIVSQLEERISARGSLKLIESSPIFGGEGEIESWCRAEIGHRFFRAVAAALKSRRAVNGVGLVGIAVDEALALYAAPPILENSLVADLLNEGKISREAFCAVSGNVVASPTVVDIGGIYRTFCSVPHAQDFQRQYVAAAANSSTASAPLAAVGTSSGPWATEPPPEIRGEQGRHRLLVIPVAFVDDPRFPSSPDALTRDVLANNRYFEEGSYGTVSFISTVTPLMTLPQRKTYYGEFLDSALLSDAIAAAIAAGYDTRAYDHIYTVFNPIPGVKFGGRSDGLLNGGAGAISHELGHNFGLAHANYWNVSTTPVPPTPNSPPTPPYPVDRDGQIGHYDVNAPFRFFGSTTIPIEEYGNPFDVMGSGGGHFSASAKNHMNWLPDKFTRILSTTAPLSETNRVYAFDTPTITPGRIYGLRVRKNAHAEFPEIEFTDGSAFGGRIYWATYRQGFPSNPWVSTGIQLNWDANGFSQNTLVDTTGDTAPGKNDSAVIVGRTFADPEIPFYLTPVAQGGGPDAGDKWVDVVVNIGPFPGNLPPTMSLSASALTVAVGDTVDFSVTASDPNGDVLAYNWDFGDGSFGYNSPANSKTFPFAGQYVVRCEVSDMKGGKISSHVVVTVGEPTTYTISGHVFDIYGNPVQGVRVHNGGTPPPYAPPAPVGYPATPPATNGATYLYTYTDSDGSFTLANVPAGTNRMAAFIYGYKTEPLDFANPLRVDGDVQQITFMATPITKLHVVADVPDAYEAPFPSPGLFTIIRDGDLSQDLPVRFALGGTAQNGFDYENIGSIRTNITFETNGSVITTNYTMVTNSLAGEAVIAAGETSVSVLVNPIDNDIVDGTRSVRLSLMLMTNDFRFFTYLTNKLTTNGTVVVSNTVFVTVTNLIPIPGWEALETSPDNQLTWFQTYPTYVLDASAEALVNIYDDESPEMPIVSVFALDTIATEAGSDCGSVVFTRAGSFDQDLTVSYITTGLASNGVDYLPLSGLITIPAGQKSVTLPIVAINDLFVEGPEDVTIIVADDPAGIYVADPSGVGSIFIVDDDLPLVSIYAPDSVASKNGNPGLITIVRAGDLGTDLVVNYLVTGSALPGADYNPLPGTVTIPAGSISADVQITPINSSSVGAKTVTLVVSDSESYNIENLNRATVTIEDNLPVVTISGSAGATEGGGAGSFTVTRTGPTTNTLTVNFAVGGSAVELFDYGAIGRSITIPVGAASATVAITPIDDKFRELGDVSGADAVILRIVSGPDYNIGTPSSASITISDNDGTDLPVISFMLQNSTVREDDGGISIAVRVSANPFTNKEPAIVAYRVTSGSAVNGVNYSLSGTGRLDFLHFRPPTPADPFHDFEDGIQFIDVPILDDGLAAGDKTFTITLFNFTGYQTNVSYTTNGSTTLSNVIITPLPTNAWIGEFRTHTVTIVDIGTTIVNIEPLVPLAFEEGSQPAYFRIWREGSTNRSLTVNLSVSGSAAPGSDYVALPSSVTIPAGTNSVTLAVIPHDDPEEEFAETVNVSLLDGPGFRVGQASARIVIVDNDGTIQFTQANYPVDESAGDTVVTVIRTGNTNRAATVDYQILDGTAIAGSDYQAAQPSGTLTFAAGEIFQQIHITIIDDSIVEPLETVRLLLTNATGGLPLGGQRVATLSILDNDISFQFVTNQFRVNENGGAALISVERLGQTNAEASVVLATVAGIAQGGVDFVSTNLILSFAAGETNKSVLIPIIDDELFEGDESLTVVLSDPSTNASVGPIISAELMIVDDECAITFDPPVFSVDEYLGYATVIVRRTGGTVNPVSVSYFTRDGTANGTDTNNLDFRAVSGQLTFAGDQYVVSSNGTGTLFFQPGDTTKLITIPLVDDALGEGNETFSVILSDLIGSDNALPGAATFGPVTNATVTIIDNETPGQVDYEFDTAVGANDVVRAIAIQSDGAIAFGGDFTRVNNINYSRIARLHPNGTVDASFNPGLGVSGPVWAVASQPDHKVLVGGNFVTVDGTNRVNLARLNANGKLDLGFDPGTGPNNTVRAIAVQQNGAILIGGDFTSVNGVVHTFLARLTNNGALDSSFSPTLGGPVYSIATQSDGKIVIAGAFTTVSGGTRKYVARLNLNGSVDATFDTGSGPNGPVNGVAIDENGKIVVGGSFTAIGGTPRNYFAKLNPNGSVDPGFAPGAGADGLVNGVATQPGGKVVVVGDFATVGGLPRNRFARLRGDGTIDLSFNTGSGANATVNAVAIQSDTAVVIGGSFTNVNGFARNRIARIHGDDKYSPTSVQFDNATYVVREDGGPAQIRITRTGNTNIVFSAGFFTADGTAIVNQDYSTNYVQLLFANGDVEKFVSVNILNDTNLEIDETVTLLLTNVPTFVDVGRGVASLIIRDDESSVQFDSTSYVTGEATNATLRVVRSGRLDTPLNVSYSTVSGSADLGRDFVGAAGTLAFAVNQGTQELVIQIIDDTRKETNEFFQVILANPDNGVQLGNNTTARVTILDNDLGPGAVDSRFVPGAGLNGFVKSAVVQPDGKVLIGGSFTEADGISRNRIARLGTNGSVDLAFNPGTGPNSIVTSLALMDAGRITVAGAFTQYNGTNRSRAAQLLANGDLDTTTLSFSNGINAAIHSVLPVAQGRVVIAGAFSLPVRGVGRLRVDGSIDSSFFPGLGADGNVYGVAQQTDGKLIIVGDFSAVNNIPKSHVARLESSGIVDNSFVAGGISTGAVYCVAIQPDGKILVAGDFTRVAGADRGRIVRFLPTGAVDPSFDPIGANGIIYSMVLQLDGKILIGGSFSSVSGVARSGIARLGSDGIVDAGFDTGVGTDGPVYTVALTPSEEIIIGGDFTQVNGIPRRGIARLNGDTPNDVQFLPGLVLAPGGFQMLISVTPGHSYVLEASIDLTIWTTLRTNVASGATLSFTDTNAASFNQRFYRVRQAVP